MTEPLPHRVLILEDDLDLVQQWRAAINALGIVAETASRRVDAELACASTRYDLVIIDIFIRSPEGELTGDGGFTFIAHLRSPALAQTPEWGRTVPIIAVSGSERMHGFDALDHARHMGATVALRKPISPHELAQLVKQHIEGTAPEN